MVVDCRPEEYDEDEDSLFGSPPPSPQPTRRPASPALALPSASTSQSGHVSRSSAFACATASTQNVGTIALPGSHPHSELPINPLALSLNHGVVSRPPALPQAQVATAPAWPNASSTYGAYQPNTAEICPSTSMSALRSTAGNSTDKKKKRSRPSSRSDNESTTPLKLEFSLPDPSAPPPAHFLRNQENLLGRAGRVAGVKPATLTHVRGSTPSNPILVDDEDTPILGRHRHRQSREPSQYQPYIDPSLLTAPTNQEIVSVLIGQKDIFPVLESILKLIMGSTPQPQVTPPPPPPPTGFERRPRETQVEDLAPPTSQSVKKRKLNRVPAGATDWDVPYPFPQGEGPSAYHKTWERERGKQLIAELIKLIKTAARKAATKKYILEQEMKRKELTGTDAMEDRKGEIQGRPTEMDTTRRVNGYYRPETVTYGLEGDQAKLAKNQVYDVLRDTSNACRVGKGSSSDSGQIQNCVASSAMSAPSAIPYTLAPSMVSTTCTSQETAVDAIDGLLSSLVAAGHGQAQYPIAGPSTEPPFIDVPNVYPLQDHNDIMQIPSSDVGAESVDQALFDTWMTFLEAFPMSFDSSANQGLDISGTTTATPTPSTSLRSTPGIDELPADSNPNDLQAMISSMFSQPLPMTGIGVDGNASLSSLNMDNFNTMMQHIPSSIEDHLIDPNLLAISNVAAPNIDMTSTMNMNVNLETMQAPSPIPSTSSFSGSMDPATPLSVGWDMSLPEVFGGGVGGGGQDEGGVPMDVDESMADFGVLPEFPPLSAMDKGKARAVEPTWTPRPAPADHPSPPPPEAQAAFRALLGMQTSDELFVATSKLIAGASGTKPNGSTKTGLEPSVRQLRKDDILKRAQEKRQRIQEELNTVKRQLWETTIEQAALVHLGRQLDGAGTSASTSAIR